MNEYSSEKSKFAIDMRIMLHDFLQIALSPQMIIFGIFILALCVGGLCYNVKRTYNPKYRATATFTIFVADPLQSEISSYNSKTAEQMEATFPYIITSEALNSIIKEKLDITDIPPITADCVESTNIFTLGVLSPDPMLSYNVLNAVIEYYPDVASFVVGPTVMNLLDISGVPKVEANKIPYGSAAKKGIFIAAALWFVVCMLRTLLRSTVHSEKELRSFINLRVLGVVPRVKSGRRTRTCPLPGRATNIPGFFEAIRLMRIRAESELHEKNIQVLIVSSAIAGEGKTTISLNLAASLAEKKKRVLIIDCDLRNPSVARNLEIDNSIGFSDYLEGKIESKELIRESGLPNLFVVVAGERTDDAAELLSEPKAIEFIESCRPFFDYIILDTPPVALLADAAEIARAADGAMITIRQNYASKSEILESAQLLSENGLPIIGCVANYMETGILSSYTGYYGYGKYYSSYHKKDEPKPAEE